MGVKPKMTLRNALLCSIRGDNNGDERMTDYCNITADLISDWLVKKILDESRGRPVFVWEPV